MLLENGFYAFKSNVIYTSFLKGDIIEVKDNNIWYNQCSLPHIIKDFILDNKHLIKKLNVLPVGSKILYNCTKFGIITEIIPNSTCKAIYYRINFNDSNAIIKADSVKLADVYYFISSKGTLCSDEIGRDINVEKFRKATDNFFLDKNLCKLKLLKILKKIE